MVNLRTLKNVLTKAKQASTLSRKNEKLAQAKLDKYVNALRSERGTKYTSGKKLSQIKRETKNVGYLYKPRKSSSEKMYKLDKKREWSHKLRSGGKHKK